MSAFMLSDGSFQSLANDLVASYSETRGDLFAFAVRGLWPRPGDSADHALAIVRDWYKANRLAILGRYGDKHANNIPENLPDTIAPKRHGRHLTIPERIALYKRLKCLAYQCAEDVPAVVAEWHAGIREEIEGSANLLGYIIISGNPHFDAAAWG